MAKQIIVATHATFAEGLVASMRFITEPEGNVHTICAFTQEMDPGAAFDRLLDSFAPDDVVVVMTDLLSGSVNKEIAKRLSVRKFYLVTGANLTTLLELACCNEADINDDFIREVVGFGKDAVVFVNDALRLETEPAQPDDFFE